MFRTLARLWFSRSHAGTIRRTDRRTRLRVETLETRLVPAITDMAALAHPEVVFATSPAQEVEWYQPSPPPITVPDQAASLGEAVSLNPQPLPPKDVRTAPAVRLGTASWGTLSLQPLPPREAPAPPGSALYLPDPGDFEIIVVGG